MALIRLTSLGDIILCMVALQITKRYLPDCLVTWIADSKFADILDHHPDLQYIIKLDLKNTKKHFSLKRARIEVQKLRGHAEFDLAIDLHGLLKSAIITRLTSKQSYGFGPNHLKEPLAGWLYKARHDISLDLPVVTRHVALVAKSLGFSFSEEEIIEKEPYLYYSQDDLSFTKQYFQKAKKNIVLIPETSMAYKNYPRDKYANIANSLGENILVTSGNKAELISAEYIADRSPFITLLPPLNLNQLKAAISQADLVIGGDTGPSHIAWANNIPSITLFGATPSNCIYATKRNRIIASPTRNNTLRVNKTDFSIRDIPERIILKAAEELLH